MINVRVLLTSVLLPVTASASSSSYEQGYKLGHTVGALIGTIVSQFGPYICLTALAAVVWFIHRRKANRVARRNDI